MGIKERPTCANCGRTIREEPLHLRGRPVCGAECFTCLSRKENPLPKILARETRRGISVARSGYWVHGRNRGSDGSGD